jgi:hypothetical protein
MIKLNLVGCCQILGQGLSPLRNSRVLEHVELTDTAPDSLHSDLAYNDSFQAGACGNFFDYIF